VSVAVLVVDGLRIVAGIVLLTAGLAKLRAGPIEFTHAILGYRLVPTGFAAAIARSVPICEVALGAALLIGAFVPAATIAASALIIVFSGAIAIALVRRQRNACGCGIGANQQVSWSLLIRNAVLVALLLFVHLRWEV